MCRRCKRFTPSAWRENAVSGRSSTRAASFCLSSASPCLIGLVFYGPFVADLFLHRRPPSRFLIPSGYVGWAKIEYGVTGAQPLPREGKYLAGKARQERRAQTSSALPEGWAHDQFFYDSGDTRRPLSNAGWCKGGMIWGEVDQQRTVQ